MATQYGWYSRAAAEKDGARLYETPDGEEVPVTSVDFAYEPDAQAADAVYVGPVTKHKSDVKCGLYWDGRFVRDYDPTPENPAPHDPPE
jgi:hypothetical protein